jgi:hypothetical protein
MRRRYSSFTPLNSGQAGLVFFQNDPVVNELHLFNSCLDPFLLSKDILKMGPLLVQHGERKHPSGLIPPTFLLKVWFLL